MGSTRRREATQLLRLASDGDERASDELVPILYDELRDLAGRMLRHERADHTLQATALVHEAYVRLVDDTSTPAERTRFRHLAATVLRNVLVDHARARGAQKRGGDAQRVQLEAVDAGGDRSDLDVLAVHDALERMSEVDDRAARVVELRFFAGLDVLETAQALAISERTVRNDWRWARAWLARHLLPDEPTSS